MRRRTEAGPSMVTEPVTEDTTGDEASARPDPEGEERPEPAETTAVTEPGVEEPNADEVPEPNTDEVLEPEERVGVSLAATFRARIMATPDNPPLRRPAREVARCTSKV